jgi:hypothetical protein
MDRVGGGVWVGGSFGRCDGLLIALERYMIAGVDARDFVETGLRVRCVDEDGK